MPTNACLYSSLLLKKKKVFRLRALGANYSYVDKNN